MDKTIRQFMVDEQIGSYIDFDTMQQICNNCRRIEHKCKCHKFEGKADLEIKKRMVADLKRLGIEGDES